ncbi:MAG TPA: hypothetical protein VFH51_01755 [Myxococcota bacterium]|nr:hypothetical protein [Myxococcota bacterium]
MSPVCRSGMTGGAAAAHGCGAFFAAVTLAWASPACVEAATAPFVEASHPPPPQVVSSAREVLAQPNVRVVTFNEDPLAAGLEALAASLGASPYWRAATSETRGKNGDTITLTVALRWSRAMVSLAPQERVHPVELLQEQHLGEAVGQGEAR